uniref:Uncharacterized protein n=1 Tax=Schizaphis graminum TaxID=13262 RepID=A0A2S2NNT1_SCHGA
MFRSPSPRSHVPLCPSQGLFLAFIFFLGRQNRLDHADELQAISFELFDDSPSGLSVFWQVMWQGTTQYFLNVARVRGSPHNLSHSNAVVNPSQAGKNRVLNSVVGVDAVYAIAVFRPIKPLQVAPEAPVTRKHLRQSESQG